MIWNEHYEVKNKHALFTPSKCSWINYDIEKMIEFRCKSYAQMIGTIIHHYACDKIKFMQKLNKYNVNDLMFELLRNGVPPDVADCFNYDKVFSILKAYVNDGIGFHMLPEKILYYNSYFFGTADTIIFSKHKGRRKLRIHDLKTGDTPAHIEQLEIYAALFCLEYDYHPTDIDIELRIYQSPEVLISEPDASDIVPIMDKIVTFSKFLNNVEE